MLYALLLSTGPVASLSPFAQIGLGVGLLVVAVVGWSVTRGRK